MLEPHRGEPKKAIRIDPRGYPKQPIVERERDEPDMPPIRKGPEREPGKQSEPTKPALSGPRRGRLYNGLSEATNPEGRGMRDE